MDKDKDIRVILSESNKVSSLQLNFSTTKLQGINTHKTKKLLHHFITFN